MIAARRWNHGRVLVSQRARARCLPSRIPGIAIDYPGQLDWRVLALSVAVCIGSTMLFALVPAIQASHVDLSGALKSESSGMIGGSGRSRLRSVLVFVQVALSFVLIAGTGLLPEAWRKCKAPIQDSRHETSSCRRWIFFFRLQARAGQNFLRTNARAHPGAARRSIGSIGPGQAFQLCGLLVSAAGDRRLSAAAQ